MTQAYKNQLDRLREILLALPPSGKDGFEGVFADALNRISGVPFRLSKGGTQFGIDGAAAHAEDAICFECKRYDKKPPASEVVIKIDDLGRRKDEADLLWVLACTAPISPQLVDQLREKAAKDGIEILTLDWAGDPPLLAVVLAKAGTPVIDKIAALSEGVVSNELEEIFVTLREQEGFEAQADKILRRLNASETATIRAAEKNRKWFADRFCNTRQARLDLGQPLAPNAVEVLHGERDDLVSCAVAQLQSEEPVVLLGDEGCGKSWLAAKVIEQQEAHTLTALFSAEQLPDSVESGQAVDLLAKQLIRQTDGDPNDDTLLKRWCRRINAWVERIRPRRFLIVLDGLNQRPKKDWGRIIESFQHLSEKAGGRLLVTCRHHYFRTKIEGRLSDPLGEITVPEWTARERDLLLRRVGIDPTMLDQQAANSLLNPRLLGIALNVLPLDDMDAWQGLTVERLLFEHIRAAERDNANHETFQDFADRLTCHAQQVLAKVQSHQRDDLLIFEDQAGAVAEGRFFTPIAGPKNAYELRQEGLSLALGFALVDRLFQAQRNNKDLSESVSRILEPVATLDDTAKVVLGALTAVTLNKSWFNQDIYEALIGGFVFLQNPNPDHYPAFVSLAKERVAEFLNTAETLTLQTPPHPNSDWIKSTLFDLRDDKKSWPLVADMAIRWLSYYTLDPEQQLSPNRSSSSAEEKQEKIEKKRSEIETKLNSLSEAERQILGEMHKIPRDPTRLTNLAISLLTGLKLEPFARALVRASLSKALNGGIYWPYKQFRHLLSFNSRDWVRAREALLNESCTFRAGDSSSTGKWALVTILYSTGDEDDEREARTLVETLREPRPWPQGWRLVEEYCSVDPCDPESQKPDNVVKTATDYQQIDVTKLHLHIDLTSEAAFLEDALPAIARFYPEIAVEKHVQLIGQLPVRSGLPLRQVAVQDNQHRPLIDRDTALKLVDILRNPSALADIPDEERSIVAQFLLLIAFPLLTGPEQLEAMLLAPEPANYLLSLHHSMKSFDEALFECRLQTAVVQDNRVLISILLAFAKHSETPLTSEVRRIIGSLVRHEIESIRADAFGTIYRRELSDLLPAVLESGCCYTGGDKDSKEAWYGSLTLIDAARQGVPDPITVLDRIIPESFGVAARQLGPEATTEIARRLLVRRNLNVRLLEKFSLEAFTAFYKVAPGALIDLADSFLGSDSAELSYIHNATLLTAYAISKDEPEKAKSLFEKVEDSSSFLRVTVWESAANPLLDELRCSRLDRAITDHELAMEVLAAEQADRHDVLDAYIEAKCSSDTPVVVARGLMVAGFCDDRQEPDRVLADHTGRIGLIGKAHSAAEYAFERNRWARHWYQKMSETEDPVQYWINKCLFAKVVDGRFYLWKRQTSDRSSPLFVYHEITEKAVKDRCEKWKRKREKSLFGQDAPEPLFIQS